MSERWIAMPFLAVLAILGLYALLRTFLRRGSGPADGLFFVAGAFALAFLLAKERLFSSHRLNWYVFIATALWVGAAAYPLVLRRLGQVAAAAAMLAMIVAHWPTYARYNAQFRDFMSVAGHIRPNTVLLPLPLSLKGAGPEGVPLSEQIAPFYAFQGYLTAEKNLVDLRNYEAETNFFPVQYKPHLNPYERDPSKLTLVAGNKGRTDGWARGLDLEPPSIDLRQYEARTGKRIDYVLVWGFQPPLPEDRQLSAAIVEDMARLNAQLKERFDLIYSSPSEGPGREAQARLWRRKDFPATSQ